MGKLPDFNASPRQLRKLIEQTVHANRVVVVQIGSERCAPCLSQSDMLKKMREEVAQVADIVQIDVDKYPSICTDLNIANRYPSVMIFRNGAVQPFDDLATGDQSIDVISGKRKNIEEFIRKTIADMRF